MLAKWLGLLKWDSGLDERLKGQAKLIYNYVPYCQVTSYKKFSYFIC